MLINPNLLDLTKNTYQYTSYDLNTKIAKVVDNYRASRIQYKLPDDLEVGKEYTFSCEIDNIDGNKKLEVMAFPRAVTVGVFEADNGRQAHTFRLNDKNTHIYLYLGDRIKGTYGSYKIYNGKLEEGAEATAYVPYKDSLEPSKQALLPPEGNYKEIQAL